MTGFSGVIILVLILTAFGTLTLVLVTVKYYWGERGAPPPSREERKLLRERELQMRAPQIEHSRNNPIIARSTNFWDNRKVSKTKEP